MPSTNPTIYLSGLSPEFAPRSRAAVIADELESISDALACAMAGIATLKTLVADNEEDVDGLAPRNPANKVSVGGQMKLTKRGIEVCWRLFDSGKTKYAVAALMDINFGAAKHRYVAWQKLGGVKRPKQPLD